MAELTLYRKGKAYNVLYDQCDQSLIDKYSWMINGGGYVVTKIKVSTNIWKTIFLHRLILDITDIKIKGDHKNRNPLDNRRDNLRKCTQRQNSCNRKMQSNNTSGIKGVYYDVPTRKWRAKITVNYKTVHLGLYEDKIDARKAFDEAAIKYNGEFANPNFKIAI